MNQEHPLSQDEQDELVAYADGQLQAVRAESVAAHLESCVDCAKHVENAKDLSLHLAAWQVEEAPVRITQSVMSALETHPSRVAPSTFAWFRKKPGLIYAFGGALSVLTVLIIVSIPSLLRSRQAANMDMYSAAESSVKPPAGPSLESLFQLEKSVQSGQGQQPGQQGQASSSSLDLPSGPMVIKTVQLTLITKTFETSRARIETIVRDSKGYVDQLSVRSDPGSTRGLSAVLRFPADRLDAGLTELRKLGQPKEESQNSSDITGQYVDLVARLHNAQNTEQRLLALIRDRTGNLKDVVAVEVEVSRVREQIERMEAERKGFDNKVQYAAVHVELSEEYRAQRQPAVPGTATRIRNAAIEGYEFASETILGIALNVLTYGPSFIIWMAVLFSAGFSAWKLYPFVNSMQRRFHRPRL